MDSQDRLTAGEVRAALADVPDTTPLLAVIETPGGQVSGWVRRVQHDRSARTFDLRGRPA